MLKKWLIVTFIGTVLGLILSLLSYIKIRKISKELKHMDETEFVPENVILNLLKYQKLSILGMSITALSQIIGAFLRK